MRNSLLALTGALLLTASVAALVPAPQIAAQVAKPAAKELTEAQKKSKEVARKASEVMNTASEAHDKVIEEFTAKITKAEEDAAEGKKDAEEKLEALYKAYEKEEAEARAKFDLEVDRFCEAFKRVDLDAWVYRDDFDIFEPGCDIVANRARQEGDAETAIRYYEKMLSLGKMAGYRAGAQNEGLPNALLLADDYAMAKEKMNALAASVSKPQQATIAYFQGELEAVHGNTQTAITIWQDTLKSLPKDLKEDDPRHGVRETIEPMLKMIGKAAPEIDSKVWVGDAAKPLSKTKGKVVVLDFWATWCEPCLSTLPSLNALHAKNAEAGLEVLGVTKHFEEGYLPKNLEELAKDERAGEWVEGMDEKKFVKHLADFKTATKISYPFVIGAEADFTGYNVEEIPAIFVIDHEGKVAYMIGSAGLHHLLANVTKQLLKKEAKADAEAKAKAEAAKKTGE